MNGPINKAVSSALPRVFSRRSAILKIVEEKALGTRLTNIHNPLHVYSNRELPLTQLPVDNTIDTLHPPFNVQTNIGRAFINLIDKCFPAGHKLRKVFNRNTVKLSYSCTPSMKQVIDGHNKAILRKAKQPEQDKTWMPIRRRMFAKRNCLPGHHHKTQEEGDIILCGSHSHRIQN